MCFATIVAVPTLVQARPFRVEQIPAAPGGCDTCHLDGGGTFRNVFGRDVEASLSGSNVDWPAVCDLDSDGDGFTNGEELGDPMCEWRRGDPLISSPEISRPGSDSSVPGMRGAVDDEGGCAAVPGSAGLALLASLLLLRPRKARVSVR